MTTSNDPESSTPPEPAPKPRSLRRRVTSRISIQSKLLMMLLVTSVLSAAVVGAIGYQSGRSSLRESVFDRLTEIRQSQSRQLREGIGDLKDSLVIYSRGATAIQAIQAFTAGFDQLNAATISPAQQQSLVDYYTNQFAPTKKAIRRGGGRRRGAADTQRRSATCRPTTPHRSPTGMRRSSSTTPATAAPGRPPTPATTTSSGRSSPASSSRMRCCSTPGATSSTPPTRASISAPTCSPAPSRAAPRLGVPRGARLERRRLRRHHRLRRVRTGRRADRVVHVAGRPAGQGRRRAGPAVPDIQDQPADDDGPALAGIRHGTDGRDVHRRPRRPDAVGLPAVPRGSRGLQARRRRGGHATRCR